MLYREIIAVCSEIHTKLVNVLCGQKRKNFSFQRVSASGNQWAVSQHVTDPQFYRAVAAIVCAVHTFGHAVTRVTPREYYPHINTMLFVWDVNTA